MQIFLNEIQREIIKPKKQNNNLNSKHIEQLRNSGAEVKTYLMRNNRIGAKRINPIDRLYEKKYLTKQEYFIAKKYQICYELANKSNHARPVLIYDGLTHSAASTKSCDGGATQMQIEASRFILEAKKNIFQNNKETQFRNKKFQIVDLQLLKILELVFEREIAITSLEKVLHITSDSIRYRIKKICEIMLDIKKR